MRRAEGVNLVSIWRERDGQQIEEILKRMKTKAMQWGHWPSKNPTAQIEENAQYNFGPWGFSIFAGPMAHIALVFILFSFGFAQSEGAHTLAPNKPMKLEGYPVHLVGRI